MENPIARIEKVLRDEIDVYSGLLALEEQKSGAIIDKDGRLMESISREQEALLSRVERLEEARVRLILEMTGNLPSDDAASVPTLTDIARRVDDSSAGRIVSIGMELKRLLSRLDSLHTTNRRLIEDNLEFYDILLSGLRSTASISTGYCVNGVEKSRVSGSMIFNKTV
ncbi:MAG: flagellar protein FlgN [Spirochaetes bacterium]|nr:flagellar protein FlgN [Spirochaetota bacterium]